MAQAKKNAGREKLRQAGNLSEGYIMGREEVPQDWYFDPAAMDRELYLEKETTAFLEEHQDSGVGVIIAGPQGLFAPKSDVAEEAATGKSLLDLLSPGMGPGEEEGELAWQAEALCAQTDPEVFFPEKGGSTRDAKKVCSGCSVRQQCLDYALSNDERFGIWGGLSERERRRLRKNVV